MEATSNNVETTENAVRAYEMLGRFLQDDEWYPQPLEGTYTYRVGYAGSSGQVTCFAQIVPDMEQLVFYVLCPVKAGEAVRLSVAEYITRANYGLRIGNFEMDFRDGEVRYKSSIDFEGQDLTPQLIRNAVYPAVQTMDHYLGGLLNVMYGGASPAEAIAEIEGR